MRRSTSVASVLSLLAAPALAAPGNIVTDIAATGSLVQQVLGDMGEVRVLLPDGASAHHYQMRPSDAQALQSADLLVWVGPELTPWLARAAGNLNSEAHQLQLLDVEGTYLQDYAPAGGRDRAHDDHGHDGHGHDDHAHDDHAHDDHAHDHDHDHDHDHAHDHDDHDHDHSHEGTDPHAWLDPQNAQVWLTAIAGMLSEQDPGNAAVYAANAEAAAASIATVEAEIRAELEPHAAASFVVFHDAYGYFTNRFGLSPAIPIALGDASTPSAARIDAIRTEIVNSGAVCAFPEYAHDEALIRTAIEGTEVRLGEVIDPEGSLQEEGAGQYEAMLRGMGRSIATCLSGE